MWEQNAVSSGFDANASTQADIDARAGMRTGASGNGWTAFFGNNGVVGINATKIPEMRAAIRDYVKVLESHLQGIDATATSDNAFRSEDVKAAVQKYVETVKEYCINLTSNLLAFSDKLQDVYNAWEKSTQQFASDGVGASTSAFAKTTKYTETL